MERSLEIKLKEKNWDPRMELDVLKWWENLYERKASKGKIFSIDTPPPYPSGRPWHIGAVAQYAQIDMIARYARMSGYNVHFPIGIDRNGIPVERYVERTLNVNFASMDRRSFIDLCSKVLDELESEMLGIMRRIGMSCDFANYYRTDSPKYRALTQSTFIDLFKRGLIYESTRPNNYCWDCKTTIADAEVSYQEVQGDLVYIRFNIHGSDGEVVIATTRPELLCSCKAVIFNPDDPRYAHRLENKMAEVPIYGQVVPILPSAYAKKDFGTGLMMVCSYGDHTDVQLFRELGLEELIAIDQTGRMTEAAGPLKGLTVKEARRALIKSLSEMGKIEKIERINHSVPVCERSNTPIEIIPMREYYLVQTKFKGDLLRIARKMKFFPDHHRQLLIDWINSLKIDWPISRRRYYATEIPLWYCKVCGRVIVPPKGRYYRPWDEGPPIERCPGCGSTEFEGEQRTFDTWMDSSVSPLFISGYHEGRRGLFKRAYPVTLRPQGKDIVRTWLYYTILRCYQITAKPSFRYVWIGGLGLDERGEKMSKSKGNVIDPSPIIERYGGDAFRFWCAQESSLGYDFRISEARIANASKFLNKLWNIARYVSQFPIPTRVRLVSTDAWIIDAFSETMSGVLEGYRKLDFFVPATRLRDFLWNTFADHYIEMTKTRALSTSQSNEARSAWFSLHYCLKNSLLLLAPIMPFMTDVIWRSLYDEESIHLQRFPRRRPNRGLAKYTKDIKEFNSEIWRLKKSMNLSLKDPIRAEIPRRLRLFRRDLIDMHNIQTS
ncbi:MAG: valine--tRNA ligase [Aigarchaeota archaeon]|nr:valine--tRNA ligase [Aigarchaeota archaeon]MDW8093247.1 valine--tRNA ligase [Nitrososphaerota archaeon]